MSEKRELTREEKSKILDLAETYVNAEKGSPDAFNSTILVTYLKKLRKETVDGVE